ncbi:protein brain tumor-like [Haliotis cracherodii]|uniref:B-box type zinc finger protein ncl-1-like n=1 Tax=Haliotis rufescens TaxID=6454 RepID=UPI001EAFD324|nr:B-box type zinc finger protein ncl-1-like [Haliotis rufescens]
MTSSSPPSEVDMSTTVSSSSDSDLDSTGLNTRCSICNDIYSIPKLLGCFHTFCQPCLEKVKVTDKVTCPECHFDTYLGSDGLTGLRQDYTVSNIMELSTLDPCAIHCTGCKSKEANVVARCFDCANFLCANCVMAHQFMHCFEGHRVISLEDLQINKDTCNSEKPVNCPKHKIDVLKMYCKTCAEPVCKECVLLDHGRGHDCQFLTEVAETEIEMLRNLEDSARIKIEDLRATAKGIGVGSINLQTQYLKAQNDINDTHDFYIAKLEERKDETLKELDQALNDKQAAITTRAQNIQECLSSLCQGIQFVNKLLNNASVTECLMLKTFVERRFHNMFTFLPNLDNQDCSEIEFISNYQAIQTGVRNTFGYVSQGNESLFRKTSLTPTCPTIENLPTCQAIEHLLSTTTRLSSTGNIFDEPPNINVYKQYGASDLMLPGDQYNTWSSGSDIMSSSLDVLSPTPSSGSHVSLLCPLTSHVRRHKMIYHCRFGEFGVLEGQFTEPSGVTVNAQNDIIVADTNNHRIQIFDTEGRFKFQFGECGKHNGQLLYPNRVSVVGSSGDIVLTERSPTHQVQVYNQFGQFLRKFGANILQHPRGVAVDNAGRIIVVECKVMRVIIFDNIGNVLNMFSCSKHLQFPNSVVVNDKEEIFISDNRAHSVKVFSYHGVLLRQIGGEGITNYPIGVGINAAGQVVVADNHNNFNITIFTQGGQLVNALESKVKHAQCFDVTLMDYGSVVLASKDYKLYIYRYM